MILLKVMKLFGQSNSYYLLPVIKVWRKGGLDTNRDRGINKMISKFIDQRWVEGTKKTDDNKVQTFKFGWLILIQRPEK